MIHCSINSNHIVLLCLFCFIFSNLCDNSYVFTVTQLNIHNLFLYSTQEAIFYTISITNLTEFLGDRGSREREDTYAFIPYPSNIFTPWRGRGDAWYEHLSLSDFFSSHLTTACGLSPYSVDSSWANPRKMVLLQSLI